MGIYSVYGILPFDFRRIKKRINLIISNPLIAYVNFIHASFWEKLIDIP